MAGVELVARVRRILAGENPEVVYGDTDPVSVGSAVWNDQRAVLEAYLEECDPSPVTPDRLAAAGWKESTRYPGLYFFTAAGGYSASLTIRPDGRCLEYSGWLGNNNVRASVVSSMGQLARLVRALGV